MPSNARLAATATQPLCPDARPRRRAQNWRAVRMPRAPKMAVEAPEGWADDRRGNLDYFIKHREIIRKFGRFPHRNAVLGRDSTPEEIEFLKAGRGF